ncbi:MAG: replicative DNA helicase [Cytophagaceae bacterium]
MEIDRSRRSVGVPTRKGSVVNEIIQGLGKLPPQATEVEEAVLGALLLERDALTNVIDILQAESFYKEANQIIYKSVLELFDTSQPIDLITVVNLLRTKGELEIVGGAYYITELTTKVSSAANIEYHARIVAEMSIKRELISIASSIHKDAFEDTTDVFDLLDKTEKELYRVSESNIRKNYAEMKSLVGQALRELQEKKNQDTGLTGVPSGFLDLDRVTSGWQKSDLIIMAARPGMGKTAFVLSAMRNAAVTFKKGVALFSLEMSAVQLVNRLIAAEAELESKKIRTGKLEEYEWQQLHHKIAPLTSAPIFIDDTPGLSIRELRTKARRLKQKHDIQLIIIDYLQLMTADSGKGGGPGNREQEISAISRSLKGLAKELDVPVIALSQLSRAVETRGGDKRPQLSDLRESGAIEQDADIVCFLYRPEYYKIETDEEGNPTKGVGEVIIAKHRNGSLETVKLRYIDKYTKFADLGGEYGDTDYTNQLSEGNSGGGDANNFFAGKTFSSKLNNRDDDPSEPAPF